VRGLREPSGKKTDYLFLYPLCFEESEVARKTSLRRTLIAGVALVVAGVLPGFLLASLAPQIRVDFALDTSQLGLTIAGFYVVSTLASSPVGRFVDRVGAVAGMRLAAVCTGGASIAVAALADGATAIAALILAAGVGNAAAGPAVSAMLHREIPTERRGLAFGAQQAGAPLGAMLAGLALPVIAIPLGWRWAYASTAVLAALAIALVPAHHRIREPAGDPQAPRSSGVHTLALAALLSSAAGVGFISFLVSYAVERGIDDGLAGFLLGLVSACAVASRLLLGRYADRRGEDALVPPGALTLAVVQRTPGSPAWAVGVMMSGLFAGAIVGPLVVGLLAEHGGFGVAWATCAGLAVAGAITALVARRTPG
jgi:MFS family permease